MTLCSICQSIPFQSLPEPPLALHDLLLDDINIQEFSPQETYFRSRDEPLGFPHQPSIEALAISAASCSLCTLINESVSIFIDAYQKARKDPLFVYRDRLGGVPVDLPLWLTRRLDGGDGFLTFTHAQLGNSILLVGAVGFCVEDGMSP